MAGGERKKAGAAAPVVLALEASADSAGAAVLSGGRVVAEASHDARHGHAARMLVLVRDCLGEAGMALDEVTAIAAGRGPGSFTGIRVALAAAKGLALSRGIAGYGLPSLEALAHAALAEMESDGQRRPVAALADTRRGSVFAGLYAADGGPIGDTLDLPPGELAGELAGHLARHGGEWIVAGAGDSADWAAMLADGGIDAEPVDLRPSARHVGSLFLARHAAGDIVDCPLEPIYLSEPLTGTPGTGTGTGTGAGKP